MSTTTTKGYKLPTTGERRTWWAQIIANFQRVNDHTHTGTDSQVLDAKNITKGSVTIPAASWVATTGQAGTFEQTVTIPVGYSLNANLCTFWVAGGVDDGTIIHPTIAKLTLSTFKIYVNDNTLTLTALYA